MTQARHNKTEVAIRVDPDQRARLLSRRGPAPRPSVTRTHRMSETGYPYEVHHLHPRALPTLPLDRDPVADAEAALAALRPCFADWLKADLTSVIEEAGRLRADPNGDTAILRRLLHGLAGNAGALGHGDVANEATMLCEALEAGRPLAPILDAVTCLAGSARATPGGT